MDTRSQTLVRRVEPQDWPAVEAAFAHSFRDCRPPQVWDWRYRRDASGPRAWRAWLVQSPQGEVLGFFGGTLHGAWLHGTPALAVIGRDAFTVPGALRGLGARGSPFLRAEAAFHDDCASVAQWCAGFGLQRRARIGEVRSTSTTLREGRWLARGTGARVVDASATCRLEPTDFASSEWDALWEQRRARVAASLVRDSAFLAWRFDARQGTAYRSFALRSVASELPLGCISLALAEGGLASIVDAQLPAAFQQSRDALAQLLQWLADRGVRQVRTFASPGCPEAALWTALGFEAIAPPMDTVPLFKCYAPGASAEAFSRELALTLADSDLC